MDISDRISYAAAITEYLSDSDASVASARLIGREVPNLFLFNVTFRSGRFVILCYDETSGKFTKILEEYSEKYNVLSGTVNPDKSLFFFVTASKDRHKLHTMRYRSYLSYTGEVTNVCKLGSRHHYTQFQLISPSSGPESPSVADKSLYLLVMVHPSSIELNIIPRELRNSQLVISGKGSFSPIVQNFLWAQWEPINKRLFTISTGGEGALAGISTVLTIHQFVVEPDTESYFVILGEFELTSIPFPKNLYCDRLTELRYDPATYATAHRLSDNSVNIVMLWHASGSLCLCIQRPSWMSRVQFPTYKIFVLHHCKAMFCNLESVQVCDDVNQAYVAFLMLNGSTIMALNPFFIHLIQINRTSRVCLSTLLPKLDDHQLCLDSCLAWSTVPNSTQHKALLYDKDANTLFYLEPSLEALLASLEVASSTLTRALIFHYIIANYRDIEVHRRLLSCILKDLCDPEIQLFLHEYLVASIFQQFTRRANSVHSRLIQHTTLNEDIIQTHAFDKHDRSLVAKITVSNVDNVLMMHKAARTTKETSIQNLIQQINQNASETERTNPEKFVPSLANMSFSTASTTAAVGQSPAAHSRPENTSFFEKLRESLSLRRNVRTSKPLSSSLSLAPPSAHTENTLGRLPFFLANPLYTEEELRPLRAAFGNFLRHSVPDGSLTSFKDTLINDYVHCVMFQVRQMLHIIWSLTINGDESAVSLCSAQNVAPHDWDCFQVLETAIICFKSNAYPVPLQVEDVYARLAFRLLDLRTLIQYLDCDVLRITEDFACEIVELESGVGNQYSSKELLNLKKEIVIRFPKSVQVDKLLPKCRSLLDYFYRTDHEYRTLMQSKLPRMSDFGGSLQ